MKRFVYSVWTGNAPNRQQKVFVKWTDAVKFIKKEVDLGSIVHSVHKEWSEDYDDGDRLVGSVDMIGDR